MIFHYYLSALGIILAATSLAAPTAISKEEIHRRAMDLECSMEEPLTIAVVGPCGHGKSTLINSLLEYDAAEARGGLVSVTRGVHPYTFFNGNCNIRLLDVEGFQYSEADGMVADATVEQFNEKAKDGIDAIVVVLANGRLDQVYVNRYLTYLDKLFGAASLDDKVRHEFSSRAIFAFTKAEMTPPFMEKDGIDFRTLFEKRNFESKLEATANAPKFNTLLSEVGFDKSVFVRYCIY